MSAFIISTETMHRVIAAINEHCNGIFGADFEHNEPGFLIHTSEQLETLGNALFALNADAVNQRYHEKDEPPAYSYRPLGPITAPEQFMALSCLFYQCSEGNVSERGLYKALDRLQNSIANTIAHDLANARKVPWDWPERGHRHRRSAWRQIYFAPRAAPDRANFDKSALRAASEDRTMGHPYAQWFKSLGKCCDCAKPATGYLMDHRNDNRGPYCHKCADKAIKAAHKSGRMHPDAAYEDEEA